ncbi:uncharacterized protein LOC105441005 [Strongylocentrotus purpuratus]|uniref:Uncharacterized protein n=1 Tax=Strongylocentrotus purpuratus TaxID=7668 RepID=A0A7M7T5C7_STRPU|nr:uncharacterized protein LOC105441005 [Strongylocentrotus purpuratus]
MGPEPEPETTPEAEPEPESEPELSPGMSSQDGVTLTEMMVPPFALIGLLLFGMMILMFTTCWKRRAKRPQFRSKTADKVEVILLGSMTESQCGEQSEEFLTSGEIKSMEALRRHYNRPLSLFLITLPAIISLSIGPCLLLLRAPLIAAFWPNGLPNINDGVACFMAPAGLVYAVTFGFTFQSVLDKQRGITTTVSTEVGFLDQILAMTSRMTSLTTEDRLKIYRLVKTEIISIMQQITGRRGVSSRTTTMTTLQVRSGTSSMSCRKMTQIETTVILPSSRKL